MNTDKKQPSQDDDLDYLTKYQKENSKIMQDLSDMAFKREAKRLSLEHAHTMSGPEGDFLLCAGRIYSFLTTDY